MRTWITDIEDLPREDHEGAPPAARRRARFTRDLVEPATSRDGYDRWRTAVWCIARPGRRACEGRIVVCFDEDREEVEWGRGGYRATRAPRIAAVLQFASTVSM